MDLQQQAEENVKEILLRNYKITPEQFILLIYDTNSLLATILTDSYGKVIANYQHQMINFEEVGEETVIDRITTLPAHSLVILVQSTSFRMTKHRLRADLFRAGHQVIEHARLGYNKEEQIENYIKSLQYDTPYYVKATTALERLLVKNRRILVESGGGNILEINSSFEKPLKNTGDFSQMEIVSAGFPIGEIFTEAQELDKINGEVVVFGFPGKDHLTHFTQPFVVKIENGCVTSHNGPPEFEEILQMIKEEEVNHAVQVREIGFGLNRQLGFANRLDEPTAFERFAGMHFSLGLKHAMYGKKLGRKVFQKYHIDIFCRVQRVVIGNTEVFRDGKYVV